VREGLKAKRSRYSTCWNITWTRRWGRCDWRDRIHFHSWANSESCQDAGVSRDWILTRARPFSSVVIGHETHGPLRSQGHRLLVERLSKAFQKSSYRPLTTSTQDLGSLPRFLRQSIYCAILLSVQLRFYCLNGCFVRRASP